MRFRQLQLIRYGKFTDRLLDFGPPPESGPDLHVIYGPNEAGKSTASNAVLDLLFGIGAQSPYGFLHPYPTMRIGAVLDLEDGPRGFGRIKRPQNSLLDAEDRPIPESALRGALGGMDRDAYRTMFLLDDETLEKGGESILASKGDLGELLFSASAGLADLGRRLGALRAEADGFYRYYGRSGRLSELKAQIAKLKEEREGLDTLAADHARLVEARDEASLRYEEAIAERTRMRLRMESTARELGALPRLATLRPLRDELATLPERPQPPAGWGADLPALMEADATLRTRADYVTEDVARRQAQADALVADPAALALAPRLARLADLRARHVTADKDIPKLDLQLGEKDTALSGLLRQMDRVGEAEPATLLLGAQVVGRLRALMESRSGVEAARVTAEAEAARARAGLAEAEARLAAAGGDPAADPAQDGAREAALATLGAVLSSVRAANHGTRRRLALQALESAQASLDDRILALAPWTGTPDALLAMRAPAAPAIAHRKAALEDRRAAVLRHRDEAERTTTEVVRLTAERQGLSSAIAATGVPGDAMAETLRARREEAWGLHRRAFNSITADVFEGALRADDRAVAARSAHAGALAQLHQVGAAIAIAEAEARNARILEARARGELQALENEVTAAIRIMAPALAGGMTLADLEEWLLQRGRALEAREAMLAAARALAAVDADAAAALAQVRAAFEAVAPGAGTNVEPAEAPGDAVAAIEGLLARAEAAIEQDRAARVQREGCAAAGRELAVRSAAVTAAAAAVAEWDAAWREACGACWLGADAPPSVATVRETLSALAALGPVLEAKEGLSHRIAAMARDQDQFRDEVDALALALSLAPDARPAAERADEIERRVREALALDERRAAALAALETAREEARGIAAALAAHEQRKAAMTGFFGVAGLDGVATALADGERRARIAAQVTALEAEIRAALRTSDLADAERRLDAADRPALEVELVDLTARCEDQDRHCHTLFAARTRAEDAIAAIGGDDRAAQLVERRRTLLVEIEEGALRYLELRAGTAAAESALAAYRERHRSAMMAKASEAFRIISRGAYSGLTSQPGKDGEVLIALSAEGGSKAANELSKGTRFQLYLALRVAGYHEFTRARVPVPFIADDIMETFDDFRAEEAFRLFADMAQDGQVIYLTHHRHLCGIARSVCPAVQIHQLDLDPPLLDVAE